MKLIILVNFNFRVTNKTGITSRPKYPNKTWSNSNVLVKSKRQINWKRCWRRLTKYWLSLWRRGVEHCCHVLQHKCLFQFVYTKPGNSAPVSRQPAGRGAQVTGNSYYYLWQHYEHVSALPHKLARQLFALIAQINVTSRFDCFSINNLLIP